MSVRVGSNRFSKDEKAFRYRVGLVWNRGDAMSCTAPNPFETGSQPEPLTPSCEAARDAKREDGPG